MALSEKQMNHPRFFSTNESANRAVINAVEKHGFTLQDIHNLNAEDQAGRVVDDLTALLLRLEKARS